jgi:hypothetical protein
MRTVEEFGNNSRAIIMRISSEFLLSEDNYKPWEDTKD